MSGMRTMMSETWTVMSGICTVMSGICTENTSDVQNMDSFNCPYSGHRPFHVPDITQGRARVLDPKNNFQGSTISKIYIL